MLFGRRKPGFAKEVELRPEDIVGEFSDAFGVEIDVADLEPENFNSPAAMWALIQKLQG